MEWRGPQALCPDRLLVRLFASSGDPSNRVLCQLSTLSDHPLSPAGGLALRSLVSLFCPSPKKPLAHKTVPGYFHFLLPLLLFLEKSSLKDLNDRTLYLHSPTSFQQCSFVCPDFEETPVLIKSGVKNTLWYWYPLIGPESWQCNSTYFTVTQDFCEFKCGRKTSPLDLRTIII